MVFPGKARAYTQSGNTLHVHVPFLRKTGSTTYKHNKKKHTTGSVLT